MSWLITATVVTGALTATQQREAGKQESFELERQAEKEALSAEAEEIKRRQAVNKALAASIVGQSISGISGEGTPKSIALASARDVSASEGASDLSDRLRQATLKRQAASARAAGNVRATSTLLKTGMRAQELG